MSFVLLSTLDANQQLALFMCSNICSQKIGEILDAEACKTDATERLSPASSTFSNEQENLNKYITPYI